MKKNSISHLFRSITLGACLFAGTQFSHAISYHVDVNTEALLANPGAPFFIDFLLLGGDPKSNSVTLSNFSFGGGSAALAPSPYREGNVTGDLGSSITMTSSTTDFYNEFYQQFVAGLSFSFDIEFKSRVNSPTPDSFAFGILDESLVPITTEHPGNSLFVIDFDSKKPLPQAFNAENGVKVSYSLLPVSVPDGGTTGALLTLGFLGLAFAYHRSSTRSIA